MYVCEFSLTGIKQHYFLHINVLVHSRSHQNIIDQLNSNIPIYPVSATVEILFFSIFGFFGK